MSEKHYLCINCTSDNDFNITIQCNEGYGVRVLGGKGSGMYSQVRSFLLTENNIDEILTELKKVKKKIKGVSKCQKKK